MVTLGFFDEPWQDAGLGATSVYTPDVMINDVTASYSDGAPPAHHGRASQAVYCGRREDKVYSVWQDARYGGTYNNRIFFAASGDRGRHLEPQHQHHRRYPGDYGGQPARRRASPTTMARTSISVVWQDNRRGHYDIWYSSSDDGGATWTPSVPRQ